ncbi:MAG TPA: TetR/AcrR family transcriptional regulator [Desertimonas sp.]|nr:TetR/AcrR family transcriptional regulator [Desertimonas sp.]
MEHADELLHQDPRIERTRRVVLDAALALLVERGYGEVTIEAVAAESGVAKSTIYRHWPSRLELINDAFLELKPTLPVPPAGNVRERLIVVLEHLAQDVAASRWSACLPALIDAAEHDPAARELNFRLASTGRQSIAGLLAEGVRTGELPADLDTVLIAEALAGPIILRRLMSAEPLAPTDVRHLVNQIVGGCPPAMTKPASQRR